MDIIQKEKQKKKFKDFRKLQVCFPKIKKKRKCKKIQNQI